MPDAARSSDPVSHGGTIGSGSSDVLTEGLPSARLFDLVKCEVHGVAVIGATSQSVLVNDRGFARVGDGCVCAGGGAAGPGQDELVGFILSVHGDGKTLDEILEETNGHGPHLEGILEDSNQDGVFDTFNMRGSLVGFQIEGEHGSFSMEAFTGELELAYVRGDDAFGAFNQTLRANASVAALEAEGTVNLDDEVSVTGRGKLFSAEAGGEFLLGDDGRRVGFIGKGGAKASAASGSATTTVDSTAGGFIDRMATANPLFAPTALAARALGRLSPDVAEVLDTPVKLEVTKGVSGASVGLDGEAVAYYDRETEETHLGLGGEIAALLGLKLDVHLTIGGRDEEADAGETGDLGPNVIVSGAASVIVGD